MPLEVNMSYEIKPGLSIGQIQLGMDRNKVNELITELEEWKDTPYGYKKEVIYDCNDDFQIMYDDDEQIFITCVQVAVKDFWANEPCEE